jgi:tetratricopeptide (TPR) repeat protein
MAAKTLFAPDKARQEVGFHPGDIILEAIRAIESRDSSVLSRWRQDLVEEESPGSSGPSGEARRAALGLAAAAWVTFQFGEAEERLTNLVGTGSHDEREPAAADPFIPFAWIVLGEVAAGQAQLARADSAFARALILSEELGINRGQAWSLIRLANIRGRLSGDPGVAARLLSEAEPLLESGDNFLRGQFHCVRAGNDPDGVWTAEADARAGLEFAVQVGIRRLHAACLHVLASDQMRRGQANEALETFREEQEEQRAIGDRAGRAATLQWAGYVLFTIGDYATSRSYLQEAVAEGRASGNLSPVAWAYLSLSGIALGLGDLSGAITYLDEAEGLLLRQGDQWGLTTLSARRASVALAAGDWETARGIWEAARAENSRVGNVVGLLGNQTGLLELAIATGDLDAAERILEEARLTARSAEMGQWEVSFFFHEAEIALKRGDAGRARAALERFLTPNQYSVRTYRGQLRYAEALALEGRASEAADLLESALDALEEWRLGLDLVGLQRYAFQVGEYVVDPDLGTASIISAIADAGQTSRAFNLAERQRGRDLYERMVLAEIGRRRAGERLDEDAPIPPPPSPMDVEAVMAAIPNAETALIEFVTGTGGEPTTAFLVGPGPVQAIRLPPVDSLERDINLLRSLTESGEEPGSVAVRLGDSLFGPILSRLPEGVSSLALVPSGSLHRVPFDLLEPGSQGPLLRRFAISVGPSASVLSRLWSAKVDPLPAFLVLGDPESPISAPGQDPLPSLPGARREVNAVARYAEVDSLRFGADASEAFLKKSQLDGYGVIHLATHALVDESSVAGTGLVLSPGDGEDGYMSPAEIAQLNLGAGMVVLSACRSAGGTLIRGEGVQGLTAPFLQAGAKSVLATQWAIDDRSSHRLILDLYRGLAEGLPLGESLQAAKLASVNRGDPPMVWAAFMAVGDATVGIRAQRPRNTAIVCVSLLMAMGLGVVGIWRFRRRSA